MTFYFYISKTANFFHFLANLTDWHYSVRQSYKKYWLGLDGPLTSEETTVLGQLNELFKKYHYGQNYWGKVFLRKAESDVWVAAETSFGTEDTKTFRRAMDVFQARFDKIWQEEMNGIHSWRQKLTESQNILGFDAITADLSMFFGSKPQLPDQIKVILLLSSPNSNGGGANTGTGSVTLELSGMPIDRLVDVWMTLWHELIHAYWESSQSYQEVLNPFLTGLNQDGTQSLVENVDLGILIKEAISDSLLPSGYLASKYFGIDSEQKFSQIISRSGPNSTAPNSLRYWRARLAQKLLPLTTKCIESGRPLDQAYLDEIRSLLRQV